MASFSWSRWLRSIVRPEKKPYRRPRSRRLRLEELEPRLAPASFVWSGGAALAGDPSWSNPLNWVGGVAPSGKMESDGTFDDLTFGTIGNASGKAVTTVDDIGGTFNSISFQQSGYTLAPDKNGDPLTLGNQVTGGGFLTVNSGLSNDVIGLNLVLGGANGARQFFTVNNNATLTLNGTINGVTGSALSKEGTGTLILAGDDSGFTGPIFIDNSSGVVDVKNPTGLGDGSNLITVGSNSQLALDGINGTVTANILLNGPGPRNDGALLNVSGNNSLLGTLTLDSDSFIGSNSGWLNIAATISDSGAGHNVTKVGLGKVIFSGSNSYRGLTTVINGILTVENPLGLGYTDGTAATGVLVTSTPAASGTLQLADPSNAGFVVQNEQITLNGPGFGGIGALDNAQANNTWTGDVILGSPPPDGSNVSIGAESYNGQPTNLEIGMVPGDPGTAVVQDSTSGNVFNLFKVGTGRVILASANTYSGTTEVVAGYLNLRDSQALGPIGKAVLNTVDLYASLELEVDALPDSFTGTTNSMLFNYPLLIHGRGVGNVGGALHSVAGLNTWAGNIQLGERAGTDSIGVDLDPNPSKSNIYFTTDYSLTITGVIQNDQTTGLGPQGTTGAASFGDTDLSKVGSGQLILTGVNTYTGNTTIEQGWITIENTGALGSSFPGIGDTVQPFIRVLAGAALHLYAPAGTSLVMNRNLILAGTGFAHPFSGINMAGALENIQGDNSWVGQIFLNGNTGIGVEDPFDDPTRPNNAHMPSQLTITGKIADLANLLSPYEDPGFTVGLPPEASGSDTSGTAIEIPNVIETGSTSGTITIHYNMSVPPDPPDAIQVWNGPRGTVGSTLIGGTGGYVSGTGAFTLTYGTAKPISSQIEIVVNPGGNPLGASFWSYTATIEPATQPGGIVKLGSQRLILQGPGTYTGPVDVVAGVLRDQNDSALGAVNAGTVTVEKGAALEFAQPVPSLNGGVTGGIQVWGKALILNGPGDTAIDSVSNAAYNLATVTNVSGDNMWRGGGSFNTDVNFDINSATRLTLLGAFDDRANPQGSGVTVGMSFPGVFDAGDLVLAGASTYRGDTNILQGVVTIENSQALGSPTGSIPGNPREGAVVVANGAQLQIQGSLTVAGKALTLQGQGLNQIPTNVPLHWFQLGPAPITNGQQPGSQPITGRVTGVVADPSDPNVIYVTGADGGAWVTKDGGLSWNPLLDNAIDSGNLTILDAAGNPVPIFAGSIAISPTDSHVLYVGTGEVNFSTDSYYGVGLLKSFDSGAHWALDQGPLVGPKHQPAFYGYAMSRVVVDPTDPTGHTVYVAVSPGSNPNIGTPGQAGIWKFDGKKWTDLTQMLSPYHIANPELDANGVNTPGADDDENQVFFNNTYYTDLTVMVDPSPFDPPEPGHTANQFIMFVQSNPDGGPSFADGDEAGPFFSNAAFISLDDGGMNSPMVGAYGGQNWFAGGFPEEEKTFFPYSGVIKAAVNSTPNFIDPNGTNGFGQYDAFAALSYAGFNWQTQSGGSYNSTFNLPDPGNQHLEYQFRELQHNTITFNPAVFLYQVGTWQKASNQPPTNYMHFQVAGGTAFHTFVAEGDYANAIGVLPGIRPPSQMVVYLGGIDQPYTAGPLMGLPNSSGNGTKWTDLGVTTDGNAPYANAHDFAFDYNNQLLVATDGGVWRNVNPTPATLPAKGTWKDLNGDLNITEMHSVSIDPGSFGSALGGSQGTGLELFSGTPGQKEVGPGGDGGQVYVDPLNPSNMYAVENGILLGSSDGGATWKHLLTVTWITNSFAGSDQNYPYPLSDGNVFPPVPDRPTQIIDLGGGFYTIGPSNQIGFPVALDQINPSRLVVGNSYGPPPFNQGQPVTDGSGRSLGSSTLWESDNQGASWFSLNPPTDPATGNPINVLSVALPQYQGPFQFDPRFPQTADQGTNTYDPNTIYITDGTTVYVTKNHGFAWAAATTGPWTNFGGTIQSLVVDPRDRDTLYVIIGGFLGTDHHIFVTNDAGRSWNVVGANFPDVPTWTLAVDPRTGDLYAGTDQGVYRLPAIGGSWARFGTGLGNVQVRQIVVNQALNTLTVATNGRGLYQLFLDADQADSGALRAVSGASTWTGPITLAGPTTISADGNQILQNGITTASLNILGAIGDANPATGSNNTLTKIGLGTVIFSGSNTYAGLTWVQQGVLAVNNPSALGSPSAPTIVQPMPTAVSQASEAALQLQANLNLEPLLLYGDGVPFDGYNTGALRNVSNNNTFTGTITLETPNVTIGVDTGSALTINSASPVAIMDGPNGPSSLTKEEQGTLTLKSADSYSGGTFVNQGVLNIQNDTALGAAGTNTTVDNGAQLQLQGGITVSNENLDLSGSGIFGTGALESVGGANTWDFSGQITLDQLIPSYFLNQTNPPVAPSAVSIGVLNTGPGDQLLLTANIGQAPSTPMGITKVGPGMLVLDDFNNYNGITTVAAGILRIQQAEALGTPGGPPTAGAVVNSGAALQLDLDPQNTGNPSFVVGETLTLNGNGLPAGTKNFTPQAGALENVSGTNEWIGPVILQSADSIGVDGNTDLTISGVIQDPLPAPVPAASMTKVGTGTLTLDNTNTYSGLTTVAQGIVDVQNNGALGGVVNEQQTIALAGSKTGSFTLSFTYNGQTGITGALLATSSAATVAQALNALPSIKAFGSVSVVLNGSTYTVTFDGGALAGTHLPQLVAVGSGGTIAVAKVTVDGSWGTVVNSGATLQLEGGVTVSTEALTLNGSGVNGLGALESIGLKNNTWTIPASGVIVPITLGSTSAIGAINNRLFISAPITDNGNKFGVNIVDTGTVQYTGSNQNSYTGLTQVNDGTLELNMTKGALGIVGNLSVGDATPNFFKTDVARLLASNQIATTSGVTVNSDGLFDLNGQTQTINSLTMAGGTVSLPVNSVLTLGAGGLTGAADAAGNQAFITGAGKLSLGGLNQTFTINGPAFKSTVVADMVISAPISGVAGEGLTKAGPGTLQLTTHESYTGTTTLTGGVLLADAANASTTVGTVLLAGGTLGGNGTVGTITAAASGGTVEPGDSTAKPGNLTSTPTSGNTDTWNAATNYFAILNSTAAGQFNQLDVNGNLALGGANLTGAVGPKVNIGDSFVIIQSSGGQITGNFAQGNVVFLSGEKFTVTYTNPANNPNQPVTEVILQRIKANTSVSVTSSDNPSPYGEDVVFTTTVSPEPGATLPFLSGDTVNFSLDNGAVVLNNVPLVNGQATFDPLKVSGAFMTPGSHSLVVTFSGDTNYNGSSNAASPYVQVVNRALTKTTLTGTWQNPTLNPVAGQPITLTATVSAIAPGTGFPNQTPDTVTFFVNGVQQSQPVQLVNGQAQLTVGLGAGSYQVTAVYGGDTFYQSSTSSPLSITVNRDASNVAVTANPTSSVFGQAVVFTGTVTAASPGSGTPTGTVTFYDGPAGIGAVLGTGTLVGGSYSITVSSLLAQLHQITVQYQGDTNFIGNSGSLVYFVGPTDTTTTVTASSNPALIKTPVTFTATITDVAPGQGVPIGTVTWVVDGVQQGQPVTLNASGQATLTLSTLGLGAHNVSADYVGTTNFNNSTGSLSEQIVSSSQSKVTSSVSPSVFGQAVTFTATVSSATGGTTIPTGSVIFVVDNIPTQGVFLDPNGQATFTTTSLSVGAHTVFVNYTGDSLFLVSTSPNLTQIVNKAQTSTTVTSSVNPAFFGQALTYTATVNPVFPGAGTLSGSVTFLLDGVAQATVPINGKQATWSPTAPISVGSHKITAIYGNDVSFANSTSPAFTQTINRAATTTSLVPSSNPSFVGQPVTFTATVAAQPPSTAMPTGSVQFVVNGVVKATVKLTNGQAAWITASLAVGNYAITAQYLGNGSFTGSPSPTITQTVEKTGTAADSTTLVSSLNPAVLGQSVSFTATVTPGNAANGPLNGFVTFYLNGVRQSTLQVNSSGQATWTPASLAVGSYKVTAQYSGDLVYAPSKTAAPVAQTVSKIATSIGLVSTANTAIVSEPVTYTATVAIQGYGSGTPTGTVTFFVDGTARATVKLQNVSGSEQATWTTSYGAPGTHRITVQYNGAANYAKSNNNGAPLQQVVITSGTAAVNVTMTSSVNPSVFGKPVTFTVNVSALNANNGTPTGRVTFYVDGKARATVNVVGGQATWTTNGLPSGTHKIVAVYSGNVTFQRTSSNTVLQTVQNNAKATQLSVTATPNSDGSFNLTVVALDAFGNQVTTFNALGQLSIQSGPATGHLLGQLAANFVNGVATFSDVDSDIPGTYVVDITAGGLSTTITLNTGGRER